MNTLWRLLWMLISTRFAPKINFFDECSTSFRVLPTDIDVLMHMNNGRYFSLMDLARMDFMVRTNTFGALREHHLYPVVASEMARFKKSLKLFQRFQITTQVLGWDDKFFYLVHHVKVGKMVYTLSLIKVRFLRQSGQAMDPDKVLKIANLNYESPVMPDWVQQWQKADKEFHDETLGRDVKK